MRLLSCLLWLRMSQMVAGNCQEWFERTPSRCQNAIFRQWCPSGSARVCGGESTVQKPAPSSAPSKKSTNEIEPLPRTFQGDIEPKPKAPTNSKSSIKSSKSKDCSEWFVTNPDRCHQQETFVKWCPGGASKMCAGVEITTTKTPEKKKEKSPEKDPDAAFESCTRDYWVPSACRKYATFKTFDLSGMACNDPDCIDQLGPIIYCSTNGNDNYDCCAAAGVPEVCEPFCNGKQQVRVNVMFRSLQSALQYLPCLKKQKDIIKCSERRHSGVNEAPKKDFERESLNQRMRNLLASRC